MKIEHYKWLLVGTVLVILYLMNRCSYLYNELEVTDEHWTQCIEEKINARAEHEAELQLLEDYYIDVLNGYNVKYPL